MAFLKTSSDLFIGAVEFQRFKEFLDDDGFRKLFQQNSINFGLFNNSPSDGVFPNFLVEQGTNVGTIKHAEGIAVDSDGEIIFKEATDNIALIDDNQWYWVKISHQFSGEEVGTVDISADGSITGTNTLFEEVLRGLPNLPSKVSFSNAVTNTGNYEVAEVISDTSAVLQGVFSAETDLKMVVFGTFTPDASPSASEQDIFQYDSSTFTLELETVSETPPLITAGLEFFVARVKRDGSSVLIQDVRSRFIYESKADFKFNFIDTAANPLIELHTNFLANRFFQHLRGYPRGLACAYLSVYLNNPT